jgi:nicotinamidase-related amidase
VKTTLLLIDIQQDYFPGGAMALDGANEASHRAQALLAAFREKAFPIVHIQHIATKPGATFFLPNTPGAEFHASVRPLSTETVVQKHFPNSFRETTLRELIAAASETRLIIAGMMSHMCVDSTTRAAADLGYSMQLAHDACATKSLTFGDRRIAAQDVHCAFMSALDGSFAQVKSSGDIIAML